MEKIREYLSKNGLLIIIILLILIFFQTCGSSETKLKKEIVKLENKIDSLEVNMVTTKDLQIEGLKNEKRMIQSTDRKILDVNRQSEIDKELKQLSGKE